MSKTGTKSLHAALEQLGYEVFDFPENFAFFFDQYKKIVNLGWTKEDFQKMYENVDATCDGPAYYFWEEILEAFPDAKVILTIRENENVWFKSMDRQLMTIYKEHWYVSQLLNLASPTHSRFLTFAKNMVMLPFGVPKKKWYDLLVKSSETVFKQSYRRHNAYVTHVCPKDQLLVYQVTEGWKPLCDFLGHPVPAKPYPHVNKNGQVSSDLFKSPMFKKISREVVRNCSLFAAFVGLMTTLCVKGSWVKLS